MPGPRYIVAYTPPPESPLARFGAGILGYDSYRGVDVPQTPLDGLEPAILRLVTAGARRTGLHGSFMSPFCLGDGTEQDLFDAVAGFANDQRVVPAGPLAVIIDEVRIVLRPVEQPAQLAAFEVLCREAVARLRARSGQGRGQIARAVPVSDDACRIGAGGRVAIRQQGVCSGVRPDGR